MSIIWIGVVLNIFLIVTHVGKPSLMTRWLGKYDMWPTFIGTIALMYMMFHYGHIDHIPKCTDTTPITTLCL